MKPIKSKRAAKQAAAEKPPETTRDKLDRLRRRLRVVEMPSLGVNATVREVPLEEVTVVEVPGYAWDRSSFDPVEVRVPGLGHSPELVRMIVTYAVGNYHLGQDKGRREVQDMLLRNLGVAGIGDAVKGLTDKVDKLAERLDRMVPADC